VADRPGGNGERPRRLGGGRTPGSGARGGRGGAGSGGDPRGGRGGPGGSGRRQSGGPSGPGGTGFRGRPGGDPRSGSWRGEPGAEAGRDRSGPGGPGGPRRGFGFGGSQGRDPGRDARGGDARGRDDHGDARGRQDRPFGSRGSGPPGGRPFDRGGSPGGFGGRPEARPPFRGNRPDAVGRPPDDRRGPDRDQGPPFRDRGERPPGGRPPFRPGSGRPPYDRSGPTDRRPSGQRAPFGGRPTGDRPWRDAPSRPPDAYRPGVAPADLLAEGEELVAGRRPVEEAFVARRPARRLLVVPQRRQALERLVLHATSLRIPVVEVEGGTLTAVAGFDGHQGIALVVEPRSWAGIDDVLARALERGEPPFVLVLDSLEDPQNVGTLLRSAEAAGVHGVLFPTHRQAPLTPAAIKASAGAVEHLLLCPVDDLPGALSDLRIRGLRVAAAEADAPLTAAQADLRGPLAIVVGSEGQGLSPVVRRRSDVSVRIPMRGAIGSLNAAVAGSILLFAAVAQRDPAGEGDADWPRPATFDEISASSALDDPADHAATEASAPPDADRPVTDLAETPDHNQAAGEPAASPMSPAPTRARKPAPRTAAQKRSRAGPAADEPAATTKPVRRKRAKPASAVEAPPDTERDPAPDDLLPGEPTDS
jgi:23S rRNA (guanosine2251-2'-O)-methyltransferase